MVAKAKLSEVPAPDDDDVEKDDDENDDDDDANLEHEYFVLSVTLMGDMLVVGSPGNDGNDYYSGINLITNFF